MQLLTPARLAALVGVLTGLSAAATAALNVIPQATGVYRAVVAGLGVLGTVITVAKFLEGQAGWEQQQAQHAHEVGITLLQHDQRVSLYGGPQQAEAQPPEAVIPGEAPIDSVDETGAVVEQEAANGEPQRLVDQA